VVSEWYQSGGEWSDKELRCLGSGMCCVAQHYTLLTPKCVTEHTRLPEINLGLESQTKDCCNGVLTVPVTKLDKCLQVYWGAYLSQ
jgi:hypothetical protein